MPAMAAVGCLEQFETFFDTPVFLDYMEYYMEAELQACLAMCTARSITYQLPYQYRTYSCAALVLLHS